MNQLQSSRLLKDKKSDIPVSQINFTGYSKKGAKTGTGKHYTKPIHETETSDRRHQYSHSMLDGCDNE